MVVETDECGFRIGLRHQNCRGSQAAPHVGDFHARFQFRLRVAERGDPLSDQMRAVVRTEKALRTGEELMVVLVPSDTFAGAKSLRDFRLVLEAGAEQLEKAGEKNGTLLVGERHRLLRRQRELRGRRVVADESSSRLSRKPFADVSLRCIGFRGELGGGHRSGAGHRLVESQFVADEDERGVHRRSHFTDGFHHEFVELRFVDWLRYRGRHGFLLLEREPGKCRTKKPRIGLDFTRADLASQRSRKPRWRHVFVILAPVLQLFYILVILEIALGLYSLWDGYEWFRVVRGRLSSHAGFYSPVAALICPCKGIEPGLEDNLMALTKFDYANYEIYFSLATSLDPALKIVERVKAASKRP